MNPDETKIRAWQKQPDLPFMDRSHDEPPKGAKLWEIALGAFLVFATVYLVVYPITSFIRHR